MMDDLVQNGTRIDFAKYLKMEREQIQAGVIYGLSEFADGTDWKITIPSYSVATVRLLISLTVDPKYSVESYDLSGAFLGTELRDRAVYIRLPRDAGIHAGKILLLKKSVYGLKTSGRDFIAQLAEQILSFLVTIKCSKTGKSESFGLKRLLIDHCVFRYEDSEGNVMILLHYVDDLVIGTTSLKIRDLFLTHINTKWKTTAEGNLNRYLGINHQME